MRSFRVVSTLIFSGLIFLVAAIALSLTTANAATERDSYRTPYRYTDHPQSAATGRLLPVFIDRDFNEVEHERIMLAIRQWNHVLNGFLQLRTQMLPRGASPALLAQIRQSGAWIVARVDSRHPIARLPQAARALALTVGGNGGLVYVISDRFGVGDLTGVMMHEIGHMLGAGHIDGDTLMAPVYDRSNVRCIDRAAASMVASAQHLPLNRLNWCVGSGHDRRDARYR